jgi:GNAT superfamily N-acetyltransferase
VTCGTDRTQKPAEISGLYALADHRGRGLGTALARTAIASVEADHLWICADEDDRPKQLYARLGFRPVITTAMFLRLGQMTD